MKLNFQSCHHSYLFCHLYFIDFLHYIDFLDTGNTVSGPSIFALADVCMYLAILAEIGPQALTVTTHCSVDFLRKPVAAADLIGEAKIIKLGKVLVVGDVYIYSARDDNHTAGFADGNGKLDTDSSSADSVSHKKTTITYGSDHPPLVARANITYSIPPIANSSKNAAL
jgi:acyl-coenzyme A thioesterase PaaI-like protein